MKICTIGHSTHSIEDFIDMLQAQGVELVADIRTIPRSRHNPQFNGDALEKSLEASGLGYLLMPELGGLRRTKKDSPNQGWINASFRGFADYMQTEEFEAAIDELIQLAGRKKTAIMCAEAVPWRCHRSLVADALVARGIEVGDIMSTRSIKQHGMTPWAKVEGRKIVYPKKEEELK